MLRERLNETLGEATSEVEKGKLFLKWALQRVFELTEDEAEDAIVDGKHDRGIDAYWPIEGEEQEREIYIIQAKVGTSHSPAEIEGFKKNIETLLLTSPSEIERTDIAEIIKKFKETQTRRLVYLTDQKVSDLREAIVELTDIKVNFEVIDFDRIVERVWERIKEPAKERWADLKVENFVKYQNSYITVVTLSELGRFVKETKDYIFESNIRQFLRWGGKVNQGIRDTLQKQPENFFYYNNGITIVAQSVKEQEDLLSLFSPQIVNGAQTSNVIHDACRKNSDMNGYVLVTIIRGSIEEMEKITRYRNSQNAVRGKDLMALSDFHKSLQLQFFEKGYFYEIQNGKFDSLLPREKARYNGMEKLNRYLEGIKAPYSIPSKDAIQAFLAGIIQRPTEAYGRPSDYLPNGRKYDDVFRDDLKDDYRLFLYPWLVKEFAKNKLGYGRGGERNKRRATFFYVFVYFYIIAKTLQVEPEELKFIENYEDKIDNIFDKFETNKSILELANNVVEKFLEDSVVDKKIDDIGIENFFKASADKDNMKGILMQKIRRIEKELEGIKATHSI